jgi:Tfp pilus assembly protein PilN
VNEHLESSVSLPENAVYWAVLDPAPIAATGRVTHQKLQYLFEEFLPVPVESLQTLFHRMPDGRFIACGVDRAVLGGVDPAATACVPGHWPSWLAISPELQRPNLLCGDLAPAVIHRARRRHFLSVVLLLLLVILLVILGLERRSRSFHRGAAHFDHQRINLITGGIGASTHPDIDLLAALRQARQTRNVAPEKAQHDAAVALGNLLKQWPEKATVQVQSLTVGGDAIAISGSAPDHAAAAELAGALRGLGDWTVAQPSIERRDHAVTFAIHLTRREAAP